MDMTPICASVERDLELSADDLTAPRPAGDPAAANPDQAAAGQLPISG